MVIQKTGSGRINKKVNYKNGVNYMSNGVENAIENLKNCFFEYECQKCINERIVESRNAIVNCFVELYDQLKIKGCVNQNNWRDVFRERLIGEDFDDLRHIHIWFGSAEIRLIVEDDIEMLLIELGSFFDLMKIFD